ncbi:hypothetical protein Y697_12455 [Mesotoga sp. BH458_6_3_2_1]|nr:hypothetical protein Y697_12455 [Mesotoga sp. BH458_6_3_2_1]
MRGSRRLLLLLRNVSCHGPFLYLKLVRIFFQEFLVYSYCCGSLVSWMLHVLDQNLIYDLFN